MEWDGNRNGECEATGGDLSSAIGAECGSVHDGGGKTGESEGAGVCSDVVERRTSDGKVSGSREGTGVGSSGEGAAIYGDVAGEGGAIESSAVQGDGVGKER